MAGKAFLWSFACAMHLVKEGNEQLSGHYVISKLNGEVTKVG